MVDRETPELIASARQSLIDREQAKRDQQVADQICAQTRLMAEDLLKDYGMIKRDISARVLQGFCILTGVGTIVLLLGEFFSKKVDGYHIWESADQIRWQTRVNSTEPPISVWINSEGGVDPKRASHIDFRVEGLDRTLRLYRNYGVTYQGKDYRYNTSQRVDLRGAQRWQALINTLQQTN